MHVYIYDSYVNQKKYDNIVARIETRITDLGLNGKIFRLGIMNSIDEVVENEIKKGAKTIVAVGNDFIFNKVINSAAKLYSRNISNKNVPIGFIPIGNEDNTLAKILGINNSENACNTLSARRIEKVILGKANNNYFLTTASINTRGTILEIDENFSIENHEPGEVLITNQQTNTPENNKKKATNNLKLVIKTRETKKIIPIRHGPINKTVLPFSKLKIINKKSPLIIDGSVKINTPVEISQAKEKLNLIVGKERTI